MKLKRKILICLFSVWGITLASLPPLAHAYRDEILTTPQEVWTAAKAALGAKGIQKEDWDKKILKSRWIEDYVTKRKEILPSALGMSKTIPNTVRRRYQLTLQLAETATGTDIQIHGNFQERPFTGVPSQLHWEKVRPDTVDYDLERVLFFKILRELEGMRSAAAH